MGLAQGLFVSAPVVDRIPLWTVAVDIGHSSFKPVASVRTDLVGACGIDLSSTTVRAAGEAVERFALLPIGDWEHTWTPILEIAGVRLDPGLGIAASDTVYPYSGPMRGVHIESTPSGVASGLDEESAFRAALLELIERDAVMRFWYGDHACYRLELSSLHGGSPAHAGCSGARELNILRALVSGNHPPEVEVLVIPSVVSGLFVFCVGVASSVEFHVGVGARSSSCFSCGVAGAWREAIQVSALLSGLPVSDGVSIVTDDESRALCWCTPAARVHFQGRVRGTALWVDGTPSVATP